jgi:hypothetical protein
MHLTTAMHQDALARDDAINQITPDPQLPAFGGPGPIENPPWNLAPDLSNATSRAIANVVPGHAMLGDAPIHRRLVIIHRAVR